MKLLTLPAITCVLALPLSALAQTDCEPRFLQPDATGTDFGSGLAMSGEHLIIGDRHDHRYCTVDPTCSNGMVYAYEKDADGRWVLRQRVEPADLAPRYAFGSAVAIDGDWMVATASGDFAGGTNGAAYFFEYDGESWVERQMVPNPDPDACADCFGIAAVMHGDTALIQGGVGARNGPGVSVYNFDGEAWSLVEIIESPDAPDTSAGFGSSMAIDDERVVIGAALERSMVANGGAAYVFRREPDGTLTFEQKLIAPDVLEGPRFGSSVAIEGDTLVVGGRLSDRTHASQGAAYAYERIDGVWQLVQEFTPAGGRARDRFGHTMAIDGDLLLVGALQRYTRGLPTGSAFVYRRGADGLWRQAGELPPSTPGLVEAYSDEVALVGATAAIGASNTVIDGDKRGAVHVFDLTCTICQADLDADGALTVFDFLTFLNLFDAGDAQADFDGDGELTIFDFLAFQTAFDAGCE